MKGSAAARGRVRPPDSRYPRKIIYGSNMISIPHTPLFSNISRRAMRLDGKQLPESAGIILALSTAPGSLQRVI
jgi:hypothetical protein